MNSFYQQNWNNYDNCGNLKSNTITYNDLLKALNPLVGWKRLFEHKTIMLYYNLQEDKFRVVRGAAIMYLGPCGNHAVLEYNKHVS